MCVSQPISRKVQLLTLFPGPVLLGNFNAATDQTNDWKELPVHRDEEQVKLDVHRAFVYYPTGQLSTRVRLGVRSADLNRRI